MVCAQHQAVIKAMCQNETLPRPADINTIFPCPGHHRNRLKWRRFLVSQFMMWVYGLVGCMRKSKDSFLLQNFYCIVKFRDFILQPACTDS